jgi:hypothetical protein
MKYVSPQLKMSAIFLISAVMCDSKGFLDFQILGASSKILEELALSSPIGIFVASYT